MGKEEKVGASSVKERRWGDGPIISPIALTYFLREAVTIPCLFDIMRHPAAPALFSMAKDTSERIVSSLSALQASIAQGTFGSDVLKTTERLVQNQIHRDPVYVLTHAFYKSTTDNGLPIWEAEGKREDIEQDSDAADVFVLDGIPYQGRVGRTMRLLMGATQQRPLTIDILAPLVYPDELSYVDALSKMHPVLSYRVPQNLKKHHPQYKFMIIPDPDDKRKSRYYIQSPPPKDTTEASIPTVIVGVQREREYMQIDNKIISPVAIDATVAQTVPDSLWLLHFLSNRQGNWISELKIVQEFSQMKPLLTEPEIRSALLRARRWLKGHMTYEGNPIIHTSETKGTGTHFGIFDVTVQIEEIDTPYIQLLDLVIEKDPRYVSLRELEEIKLMLGGESFFTFPNGSTLVGRNAKLAYLLLKVAPKFSFVPHLQRILYDEVSPETRENFFYPVLKGVKRSFFRNLPEVAIEISNDKDEKSIAVVGYGGQLELDRAMSKRKAATVFRRFPEIVDSEKTVIDPEIMKAFVNARPIIDRMNNDESIYWGHYSKEYKKALLQIIAYELDKPVSMLNTADFKNERYEILGNRNLHSFYQHLWETIPFTTRDDSYYISSNVTNSTNFLEYFGITPTVEDFIEQIKSEREIPWDRMSWELIGDVLKIVLKEDALPIQFIGYTHLVKKRESLGGKSLIRFYNYLHTNLAKSENETALEFLRRKLGLPKMVSGIRAQYRWNEMQKIVNELAISPDQEISSERLLLLTERIAKFYNISFPQIEIQELQNEAYVITADTLSKGKQTGEELILEIQKRLEGFVNQVVTCTYYREKSIELPVGSSNKEEKKKTISDMLELDLSTQEFSPEWRERLIQLTPLQRFLVLATPDDTAIFEVIADEIKKRFDVTMDIDMLQENYQEALYILRATFRRVT